MRRHEGRKVKRFATQRSRIVWRELIICSTASDCAISLVNKSLTKGVKKGKPVITEVVAAAKESHSSTQREIWSKNCCEIIDTINPSISLSAGSFMCHFFCVCCTDEIIVKLSNQNIFIASRSFRHFRWEMMWKLVMSGKGFMLEIFLWSIGRLL
jgi:hypothetical protein